MNGNGHHENTIITVACLDKKQIEHLDKLDRDYYFKFGRSLPRGRILRELVNLLIKLNIDLAEMEPKETLSDYIARKIKNAENAYV